MGIKVTGRPLTLEHRIIGALLARGGDTSPITMEELAAVEGVIIDRQGDTVRIEAGLHQHRPAEYQIAFGPIDEVSVVMIGGERHRVVMVDGNDGRVWVVPD